ARARNAFRATRAHNTVEVGGAEINPVDERQLFALAQIARPTVERFEKRGTRIELVASHDGYRRLSPAVAHTRTFSLDSSTGALTIADELIGEGEQASNAFIHLAPDTEVTRAGDASIDVVRRGARLLLDVAGAE